MAEGRVHDETVQSTSMFKKFSLVVLVGASSLAFGVSTAAAVEVVIPVAPRAVVHADQSRPAPTRVAYAQRPNMGGGFIEFLFSGEEPRPQQRYTVQQTNQPQQGYAPDSRQPAMYQQQEMYRQQDMGRAASVDPAHPAFDPKYEKQLVEYHGKERAGTIVVDTPNKFLYLVQGDGTALRYGIGVGRPGFAWSGVKTVSAKKEWPDWTPPAEMLARRPDLPRHMEGGPENPLGARAMYLGSSLYRIHGSNEPWTIGTNVSSGCIRMRNEDVIDLYDRVRVGARVVVI
jgi:lipoprotein-anchoring transpeptidase ErfK/SrfK